MSRLAAFLDKPARAKYESARFHWMKLLASLPFCPVRYRLRGAAGVQFWWSYVFMSFVPGRPMFQYDGDDAPYLRLLSRLLRPGMVVLDVGAFHGLYALVAARCVGPSGRVVAFEPSVRDRRRLSVHVWMNGLANLRVEPYAVSSAAGEALFYVVRHGFTTMNSLRPPPTTHPVDRTVARTIALGDYCGRHGVGPVDLVKVDVEGGELALFRGAQGLLRAERPLVLCEVLDWVTRAWGYEAREIVRHLARLDYDWYDVDEAGGLRPHRPRESYPEVRNYLAVPRERRAAVDALRAT